MQSQARSRNEPLKAGHQLLSPTFQQQIQHVSYKTSLSQCADISTACTTSITTDSKESIDFNFDKFTLESVRGRKRSIEHDAFEMAACLNSNIKYTIQNQQSDNYHAFYYDEKSKPNPLSSSTGSVHTTTTTEDLESSRLRFQNSFHNLNRDGNGDMNQSTFHLSSTAAAAGFPMAKKKQLTTVLIRGWLQKRKGLVLKRWKPYYCLFKSDDSLCLYANENTVNGKLKERYQVLRVVLTDKNDSFHLIGVDAEGSPRREELRTSMPSDWIHWAQAFGRFFDCSSMEQAIVRVPQFTFTKTLIFDEHTNSLHGSLEDQSQDQQHNTFGRF
ncbi:putative pleckstrin domain, PH-like domain superfamily [Plasmopara halstedii]